VSISYVVLDFMLTPVPLFMSKLTMGKGEIGIKAGIVGEIGCSCMAFD